MKPKLSLKPQNFQEAWYYESPESISVFFQAQRTGPQEVGRISAKKLIASIERMGYVISKVKQ